ncbi:hypothetical protein P7K49_008992, partial [Saguinus oedipus]
AKSAYLMPPSVPLSWLLFLDHTAAPPEVFDFPSVKVQEAWLVPPEMSAFTFQENLAARKGRTLKKEEQLSRCRQLGSQKSLDLS